MDTVARPVQDAVSFCCQRLQQPLYAEPVDRLPLDTHVHPSMLNDSLAAKLSPKQVTLPNVGQTRCYWALLTSSLQFLVLDPVLAFHLKEQAVRFLESSLLDFVHPEEQESARHDLGNVLEERTLHGSVTRVRYCRLSRVRRLLGCQESTPPYPPTFPAERIAIDSDYMAVYLVINCVAEGLVLCFIHAVVDIAPREDNDEIRKTAWTNWCSTYGFDEEQARALYQRLCETVLPNQVAVHHDADQPLCVLQILRNQHDRPLVLSWPPSSSIQARYVTPAAQDLARLAQHVQIGYSMGGGGGGDARTSCTRRYKSVQNVNVHTAEGIKSVQVESIFIPHGTIIFACHKVDGCYLTRDDRESSTQTQQSLEFLQMSGHDHQQLFSDQSSYDPSFLADSSQHELTSQAYVQQWVEGQVHVQLFPQQRQQQLWDQIYAHTESSPSNCSSVFHTRTDSYSTESACGIYQDQWSNQAQFLDDSSTIVAGTSYVRAQSPCAPTGETLGNTLPSLLPTETTATVHALANVKRISPTSLDDAKTRDRRSPAVSGSVGSQMENYSGCGRSAGNPRAGAMRCSSCQATHSPEWRKGPSGKKDLCNACGLRFARSRAKKEGVTSRKRKEKEKKALVVRRDQTTPVSGASDVGGASSSRSSAQSFVRSQRPDDSCDSASSLPSEAPITPSIPNIQSQSHYSDQNMPAQSLTPSPTLPDFPYLPSNRVDVRQQHLHPESHAFVTAGPYYPIAPSPSYISQQEHGPARTLPTILSAQYRPRLVSSEQPVSSFFERNTAEDKTKARMLCTYPLPLSIDDRFS